MLVTLLTLALGNCWCDGRWSARAVLVGVVLVVWLVELSGQPLPFSAFAASVVVPVGWLIFTDNGSVSGSVLAAGRRLGDVHGYAA